MLKRFFSDTNGTSSVEYALIISCISVATAAAATYVGGQLLLLFDTTVAQLGFAITP